MQYILSAGIQNFVRGGRVSRPQPWLRLCVSSPVDILAINETRLAGYETVRRDRGVNGKHGGGVCFYVRLTIHFLPRPDLSMH